MYKIRKTVRKKQNKLQATQRSQPGILEALRNGSQYHNGAVLLVTFINWWRNSLKGLLFWESWMRCLWEVGWKSKNSKTWKELLGPPSTTKNLNLIVPLAEMSHIDILPYNCPKCLVCLCDEGTIDVPGSPSSMGPPPQIYCITLHLCWVTGKDMQNQPASEPPCWAPNEVSGSIHRLMWNKCYIAGVYLI